MTERERFAIGQRLQRGREKAALIRAREGRRRVSAWRAWTAKDAELWGLCLSGDLSSAEYRRRSGPIPEVPRDLDYKA